MRVRAVLAKLGARDKRALGLGLAVLAGAWVALRGVPRAVREASALHERAAAASATLGRARQALATEPATRESLAARAGRLVSYAPRLFAGTTATEAGAELAAFVSGRAALRLVRIVRQNAGADSVASLFTRSTLRLEAEGDVIGLAAWIADLEEGDKLIAISSLRLEAPEPAAPGAQPERLRAELVVTAWADLRRSEASR